MRINGGIGAPILRMNRSSKGAVSYVYGIHKIRELGFRPHEDLDDELAKGFREYEKIIGMDGFNDY